MKKRSYLSLCSLFLIPFSNNLNVCNTYSNSNNNFKFQYKIETIEEKTNYPLYKINDPLLVDCVSKFEMSYKYPSIDYKNILCSQVFRNNELKKYKKEILYFIENLNFVNESNLEFIIGSEYSNKIEVEVDGITNKFGYYLGTINATNIKFQNMNVNFKIVDKEYNFELKYYLVDNFLTNLNYFENVNELNNFINKYGV